MIHKVRQPHKNDFDIFKYHFPHYGVCEKKNMFALCVNETILLTLQPNNRFLV